MFNNLTPILKDIDNQILLNSNKDKTKNNKIITEESYENKANCEVCD